MQANIGSADRLLRILACSRFMAATVFGMVGPWGWLELFAIASSLFHFRLLGNLSYP